MSRIMKRPSGLFLVLPVALVLAACGGAEARKMHHLEKGQSFLTAGNLEKARVEFRNALQIAPNDSDARFENGVVDEKLGNAREAGQFYQGAIDVNPNNAVARIGLARLYVFAGAPERALETLKPVAVANGDNAALLAIRAAAKVQLKDVTGALADAKRGVQLAPASEDAVSVLAGIYKSQGNLDKAEELLQRAIVAIPATVDLRLELAQLYASSGHASQVEEILVELVRQHPVDKAHRLRLAQFYAHESRIDESEKALRDGIAAMPKERDLKTALVDFLAVRRSRDAAEKELLGDIAADPKDYELRFALGQFYEESKELDKAAKVYQGVIGSAGLDGPGITARNHLATVLLQRDDVPAAERLVSEVLAKNPRDNDALILRGNLALAHKDPKTAIADLRSVLRDQPNAIGVMRSLARAHLANGEPALAEETMRRAVDANPKDSAARLDLAQVLIQVGKPSLAAPVIAELVKQQPDNIEALDAQFKIAAAANDLVLARSDADALVALRPKMGLGYYFQGMLAESQRKSDEAVRLYSKSLDMQADAPEPLEAVTRVLLQMKRSPEALARLEDAMNRDPKSAIAANLRGSVLASIQRFDEAKVAFDVAIERDPQWPAPYRSLAALQMELHDDAGAILTLQRGIHSVALPDALNAELANLYVRSKRPDDAVAVYEAQLKRNAQSDMAANNLAMLLVTYKRDPASLDRAKALAVRFSSSANPDYLDTYGWVLYKRGEGPAAVAVLQNALTKTPDSSVSLYHLGMAEVLTGQPDAARDYLSRSLKSGKTFPGMDEAKAALETLAKMTPASLPQSKT